VFGDTANAVGARRRSARRAQTSAVIGLAVAVLAAMEG